MDRKSRIDPTNDVRKQSQIEEAKEITDEGTFNEEAGYIAYRQKYNLLQDPEVFKQQADQHDTFTEVVALLSVARKLLGCKTNEAFNAKMHEMYQETRHFTRLIRDNTALFEEHEDELLQTPD